MNRQILILLLFAAWPGGVPSVVNGQSDVVEGLYGQGVHAYHAGMLNESLDALDQAIKLGTRDPRVYYYHGVTQSALGNLEAAATDFSNGAKCEFASIGRFYSVGRALERVQGDVRMQIETARQQARVIARDKSNPSILNGAVAGSLALPVIADPRTQSGIERTVNLPDTTGRTYPNIPFPNTGGTPKPVEPKTVPQPATGEVPIPAPADPVPEADDLPPAEDADGAGETAPAEESPFGEEPMDEEAPSDDAPADNDPFGDQPASDEPADDQPTDDDPFGDGR